MGSLDNTKELNAMRQRISKLTPDAERQWGQMTVQQMVPHVTDQLRLAMYEIEAADKGNFFTKTFLKWMILAGMPIPKGKASTAPELNQQEGKGTPPTDLGTDVQTLNETIDRFCNQPDSYVWNRHPLFGKLSGKQWKKLAHGHLHHHLMQFGV